MKNGKKVLIIILSFFIIILTAIISVAWFSYSRNGVKENIITSGEIKFIYEENDNVGNGVLLEDAMPMPDSYGKTQDNYFDFKVTSTSGSAKIPYEITLRKTENSDNLDEYVKVYLTKINGSSEEEKVLEMYDDLDNSTNQIAVLNNEKTLYEAEVPAGAKNYTDNYRLRIWLNDNESDGSVLSYQQTVRQECTDTTYTTEEACKSAGERWIDVAESASSKNFVVKVNVYAEGAKATEEDKASANSTEISSIQIGSEHAVEVDGEPYNYYTELISLDDSVLIDVETANEDATVNIEKIDSIAMKDIFSKGIVRLSSKQIKEMSLGDNYYRITVTSANGQVVSEPKILKLVVKEPIASINVLTQELGTSAIVKIDYLNHTNGQYKIGANGTWKNYPEATENNPEPTITITSYDAINYANQDGTVTLYAKATGDDGVRETSEKITVLDLDMPVQPSISVSNVYPMLTSNGMIVDGDLNITFDDRNDITNYVSLDNGTTWTEYTGNERVISNIVKAKSVKNTTGLTSEKTLNVSIMSDAIDSLTYDTDMTSYSNQAKDTIKYFKVDSNIIGKTVRIYLEQEVNSNSTIKVYNSEKQEIVLDDPIQFTYPVTLINIPANTVYIGLVSSSNILKVDEIDLRPDRSNSTISYPVMSINEVDYDNPKIVNVEYPSGYTNQYSTNNGSTWSNYVGPISVARAGLAVFARTLDGNNNVISTSSFNVFKIGAKRATSLLDAVSDSNLIEGVTDFEIGEETYGAHVYVYDTDQVWNQDMTFGDIDDVASGTDSSQMATNMVVVKVNGNLTINSGVNVTPFSTEYGGPKGFMLYVTGTLVNYGTIDNSHGAYAEGQDVILYKNSDGTYEIVPADGADGGEGFSQSRSSAEIYIPGNPGENGIDTGDLRATGGGGTGSLFFGDAGGTFTGTVKAGGTGTSYSGGTGSGGLGVNTKSSRTGGTAGDYGGIGGSGMGARYDSSWASRHGAGGAGNPGGDGMLNSAVDSTYSGENGTGGLLIVYAGILNNSGTFKANGSSGGAAHGSGGASGGGTINIFYDDLLALGSAEVYGGAPSKYGGYPASGSGGNGTVNIGSIKTKQYIILNELNVDIPNEIYVGDNYSLPTSYIIGAPVTTASPATCTIDGNEVINTKDLAEGNYTVSCTSALDSEKVVSKSFTVVSAPTPPANPTVISGDSILAILRDNNLNDRYYTFAVNDKEYPVHIYTYNGNQNWNQEMVFGDSNDVASGTDVSQMATRMVIVKINGDLVIGNSGIVRPYYNELYGGPKGFLIYVTGSIINNGTIDNSHGAYATGEDVYLWKNGVDNYEFVPAQGALGGASVSSPTNNTYNGNPGSAASTVLDNSRATGGGASGAANFGDCSGYKVYSGAGAAGTSYSGGSGGGGSSRNAYSNYDPQNIAQPNGGTGGVGSGTRYSTNWAARYGGGGAGNPGGLGGSDGNGNVEDYIGENGTGGLLIIYGNSVMNGNTISANGSKGGVATNRASGGSSGGGSINIFYNISFTNNLNIQAAGGEYADGTKGGLGGEGSVSVGSIATGSYVAN